MERGRRVDDRDDGMQQEDAADVLLCGQDFLGATTAVRQQVVVRIYFTRHIFNFFHHRLTSLLLVIYTERKAMALTCV